MHGFDSRPGLKISGSVYLYFSSIPDRVRTEPIILNPWEALMIRFKACNVIVAEGQLEIVKIMYPYPTDGYQKLRVVLLKFLLKHYPELPLNAEVFIRSQHNGFGSIWGVVLIKYPGESFW